MYDNIDNKFLYDNTNIGFSFQFFSPLSRKKLASKLSKYLGKNVIPLKNSKNIKFVDETVYISPDFSGGFKMNRIDTDLIPYHEAVHVMLKCMNFIDDNGFTNSRSNMNIKLSLNEMDLNLKYELENLNIFKYVLMLNENKIFKWWPATASEKEKIHQSKAIFIYPKTLYSHRLTSSLLERINPLEYNFPKSSHFGTDFSKLINGYISIRYAGGKGYQNKKNEAIDLINYVSKHTYDTLKNNWSYDTDEKRKISKVLEKYQHTIDSTKSYEIFKHSYPDISILVNLNNLTYLIESNYTIIRNKLFQLIACCEMKDAIINYDTKRQRVQVKGAKIKKGFSLSEMDFFDCYVEADTTDCLFEQCKIRNSNLDNCVLHSNNDVKYSKVIDCQYTGHLNEIRSSYINGNPKYLINAELTNCVVIDGNFSRDSKVDDKTELINNI